MVVNFSTTIYCGPPLFFSSLFPYFRQLSVFYLIFRLLSEKLARSLRKRLMRLPLRLRLGSLPLPSCPSGNPPSPKEGFLRSLRKRLMRFQAVAQHSKTAGLFYAVFNKLFHCGKGGRRNNVFHFARVAFRVRRVHAEHF